MPEYLNRTFTVTTESLEQLDEIAKLETEGNASRAIRVCIQQAYKRLVLKEAI